MNQKGFGHGTWTSCHTSNVALLPWPKKKSLQPRYSWDWSAVQSCDISWHRLRFATRALATYRYCESRQCRTEARYCTISHNRTVDQPHEFLGRNDFYGQGSTSVHNWCWKYFVLITIFYHGRACQCPWHKPVNFCQSSAFSRCSAAVSVNLPIDNLQNYCLGTRYGARSRSWLCRRLSISLVRYRHGLEKFLEHHFIPIRRRFNPHDLPTDLLQVQEPILSGKKADLFERKRRSMARNGDAVDGVLCLVLVQSFIAYLKLWASFFFNNAQQKIFYK